MTLNLDNVSKITFNDLLNDAITSGDATRLDFLEGISKTTAPQKNKKTGETKDAPITLMAIRSAYLKKYHNYVPGTTGKETIFERREKLIAAAKERMAQKGSN